MDRRIGVVLLCISVFFVLSTRAQPSCDLNIDQSFAPQSGFPFFASIDEALDYLRGSDATTAGLTDVSSNLMRDVYVCFLRDYFVYTPQVFNAATAIKTSSNARLIFSGRQDFQGRPLTAISGGFPLTWSVHPSDARLLVATVPVSVPIDLAGSFANSLYVNGERRRLARLPNKGFFTFYPIDAGIPSTYPFTSAQQSSFKYDPADAPLQSVPPADYRNIRMHSVFTWDTKAAFVVSLDESNQIIQLDTTGGVGYGSAYANSISKYFLEGTCSYLDMAGEFCFSNSTRQLTYFPMPGETVDTLIAGTSYVGIATQLMQFTASGALYTQYYEFRSLLFMHTSERHPRGSNGDGQAVSSQIWAVIKHQNSRFITYSNCVFSHLGNYVLWLGDRTNNVTVINSVFSDLGTGGVRMGRESTVDSCYGHVVANNVFEHGGRIRQGAIGVLVQWCNYNTVEHNEIYDFFYTGISVGWNWGYQIPSSAHDNLVSYNHIHHLGLGVMSDMACIYTLGISNGSRLEHNLCHDVETATYGDWGIYNDEGSGYFYTFANVVYNTRAAPLDTHYGRDNLWDNNWVWAGRGAHAAYTFNRDMGFTTLTASRTLAIMNGPGDVLYDGGQWISGRTHGRDNVVVLPSQCGGGQRTTGRSRRLNDTLHQSVTVAQAWLTAGEDANSRVVATAGDAAVADCASFAGCSATAFFASARVAPALTAVGFDTQAVLDTLAVAGPLVFVPPVSPQFPALSTYTANLTDSVDVIMLPNPYVVTPLEQRAVLFPLHDTAEQPDYQSPSSYDFEAPALNVGDALPRPFVVSALYPVAGMRAGVVDTVSSGGAQSFAVRDSTSGAQAWYPYIEWNGIPNHAAGTVLTWQLDFLVGAAEPAQVGFPNVMLESRSWPSTYQPGVYLTATRKTTSLEIADFTLGTPQYTQWPLDRWVRFTHTYTLPDCSQSSASHPVQFAQELCVLNTVCTPTAGGQTCASQCDSNYPTINSTTHRPQNAAYCDVDWLGIEFGNVNATYYFDNLLVTFINPKAQSVELPALTVLDGSDSSSEVGLMHTTRSFELQLNSEQHLAGLPFSAVCGVQLLASEFNASSAIQQPWSDAWMDFYWIADATVEELVSGDRLFTFAVNPLQRGLIAGSYALYARVSININGSVYALRTPLSSDITLTVTASAAQGGGDDSDGFPMLYIIIIAAAGGALLLFGLTGCCFCCRKRRERTRARNTSFHLDIESRESNAMQMKYKD